MKKMLLILGVLSLAAVANADVQMVTKGSPADVEVVTKLKVDYLPGIAVKTKAANIVLDHGTVTDLVAKDSVVSETFEIGRTRNGIDLFPLSIDTHIEVGFKDRNKEAFLYAADGSQVQHGLIATYGKTTATKGLLAGLDDMPGTAGMDTFMQFRADEIATIEVSSVIKAEELNDAPVNTYESTEYIEVKILN